MGKKIIDYFLNKGLFQLFLLTCSVIFLYPFVWMMFTSVKTGDESQKGNFFPTMPKAVDYSPYVREVEEVIPPGECAPDVWKKIQPVLHESLLTEVKAYTQQPETLWDENALEHVQETATQYLLAKVVRRMPSKIWKKGEQEIVVQFQKSLGTAPGGKEGEIKRAFENTQSRLIVANVKVRSIAGDVIYSQDLNLKNPPSKASSLELVRWHSRDIAKRLEERIKYDLTITGPGELKHDSDGKLVLRSNFSEEKEPITLKYKFTLDSDPADFHRIAVGLGYDDTWHAVDADLVINGEKFEGTRTTWLGENNTAALTLQLPRKEKEVEWGKRLWVNMDGEPLASAEKAEVELTLTLTHSSTAVARYAKVKRNFERIFLSMPFWGYVWNSIVMTLLIVLGAVFSSCFIAYAFARLKWPGRSIAFIILLSTMMLPPQVTMIPQFLIWRELGWYNTLNPLWVPAWFGIAFFIFLMVQQMKGIPRDLEEAAEVDGMNRLQIWWYVIVPLVRPGMAAIAIMAFMGAWNEFMAPLIYLRDMGKFPLSVGIYAMGADETMNNDMALILAGNFLMTLPVIFVFFLFQRYFIQGMASSGVKG